MRNKPAGAVLALVLPILFCSLNLNAKEELSRLRLQVDRKAGQLIDSLARTDPQFSAALDTAAGYFAGQLVQVQALVAGAGSGTGVLVDLDSGERIYLDVTRFDLGPGFGGQAMSAVILIHDRDVLNEAKTGNWNVGWGAEAAAGEAYAASRRRGRDYSVYAMTNEGLLAVASLRVVRFRLNPEMNNLSVSAYNIPNWSKTKGVEEEPGTWNRTLPFLARKVVEKGYKLPLPYGAGLIYAHAEQEQNITDVRIGFGGSEKVPVEAIIFDEVISTNNSYQFKLDGWILPFMNVFASVGYIDGKGPISLRIDGDTLLEDLGINCGGIIPHPLCKILGGKEVTFPVTASFQGVAYTGGTLIAGGWNGWFFTLPVTFTYTDLKDTRTDGYTMGFSPRGGRVISLQKLGNLAVFFGAQYIKAEMDLDGSYTFPGTDVSVEYLVSQSNKDRWTLTLGYNWEINRRWSWSFEYSGFIGSRKTFVTTTSFRF